MTREQSLLTRTLQVGSVGKDVEAAKRTVCRYLKNGKLRTVAEKPELVRRTFGPFFAADVVRARRQAGFDLRPIFGPAFLEFLVKRGAPDALAIDLFNQYRDGLKPPAPPKPKLVEPRQGFGSLHRSLWEAYSIGRNAGLTDLGTHNPASRLPSGRPSDHAVYPAYAFDLGIPSSRGFDDPVGRAYVNRIAGRPEVEYIILGNRIYSRGAWRPYTYGGHETHAHVSGVR